jgi:hypothetical protein
MPRVAGVYGGPHPAQDEPWQGPVPRNGLPWVAAVLLLLSAVLAVSGSFATLSEYRVESASGAPAVATSTAWGRTGTETPSEGLDQAAPPIGIPLVVAAVLAIAAAFLLLRSTADQVDPVRGRILGGVAAGLLAGSVAVIWIEQLTFARNAAANASAISGRVGGGSPVRATLDLGAGAYLLLVAALLALVAALVLLAGANRTRPALTYPSYPYGGPPPGPPPGA